MWRCPKCQAEVLEGQALCGNCRDRLAWPSGTQPRPADGSSPSEIRGTSNYIKALGVCAILAVCAFFLLRPVWINQPKVVVVWSKYGPTDSIAWVQNQSKGELDIYSVMTDAPGSTSGTPNRAGGELIYPPIKSGLKRLGWAAYRFANLRYVDGQRITIQGNYRDREPGRVDVKEMAYDAEYFPSSIIWDPSADEIRKIVKPNSQ